MGKITAISYDRTFNLGNYRSEKIGTIYELEEDEAPEAALHACRELVLANSTQGMALAKKAKETPTGPQIHGVNGAATKRAITGEEISPNVPAPGYKSILRWIKYEGEANSHYGEVVVHNQATGEVVLEEGYPNKSQARKRLFELTIEEIEGNDTETD